MVHDIFTEQRIILFVKLGRFASEEVIIGLFKCKRLPLLYCCNVLKPAD